MSTPPNSTHHTVKPLPYPTRQQSPFRTLLWAEVEPRRNVLRFMLLLLLLFGLPGLFLLPDLDNSILTPDGPAMPSNPTPTGLVIAAMLYSAMSQGARGSTARPPWHQMALPVSPTQFLLPRLVFHTGLALVLGILWWLNRIATLDPLSGGYTLGITLAATIQLQAALLWWGAAPGNPGLIACGKGLVCALGLGLAGSALTGLDTVSLILPALVLAGYYQCFRAARAMRGGHIPRPNTRPFPIVNQLSHRLDDLRISRPAFRNRLSAQIWFEWRRTACWVPLVIALGAVPTLLIEVSWYWSTGTIYHDLESIQDSLLLYPSRAPIVLVVATFWFLHLAVTKSYRQFVFSLPTNVHRVGRAKLVAMTLAALSMIAIGGVKAGLVDITIPDVKSDAHHRENETTLKRVQESIRASGTSFLGVAYGPTLMLPFFLEAATWGIERADENGSITANDLASGLFFASFALIPLLLFAVVASMLLRRVNMRAHPFPWELGIGFLVAIGLFGAALVERLLQNGDIWTFTHNTFGSVVLMTAILAYGLRARVIGLRFALAILAGFLAAFCLFYEAGGGQKTVETTGYWLMLAGALPVLYPIVIRWQREETESRPLSKGSSQMLLFFVPIAWIALHLLGEHVTYEEDYR